MPRRHARFPRLLSRADLALNPAPEGRPNPRHILLVGFMGAGKSTVGRLVAECMRRPFVDLDRQIAQRDGRQIPEIFAAEGENGFRALESEALSALETATPAVVACGGGIVLDPGNRAILRSLGTVVYLTVDADEALRRISDRSSRPLLSEGADATEDARSLLVSRVPLYESVADHSISTSGRSCLEVAADVLGAIGGAVA